MQNNKTSNKNECIVIGIPKGYIQDFVEANYGRRLTESELKELSWLVWDDWDSDLLNWIGAAVDQIIKPNKVNKYKL